MTQIAFPSSVARAIRLKDEHIPFAMAGEEIFVDDIEGLSDSQKRTLRDFLMEDQAREEGGG